jgi:hypothetical protein
MRFKHVKVRLVLSSLLAVLALGAVAASASAEESHEWLISGKPVETSTPVTVSGEMTMLIYRSGEKETMTCSKVEGKGTVAAKGKGSVTALTLSCNRSILKGQECERGTLKVSASRLPWKTEIVSLGRVGNRLTSPEFEWTCTLSKLGEFETVLKQTCAIGEQRSVLNLETGFVRELWDQVPGSYRCSYRESGESGEVVGNHFDLKTATGELSFR